MLTIYKDTLIGYALIALFLAFAHIYAHKIITGGFEPLSVTYTYITSDSAPHVKGFVHARVERSGIGVYDDVLYHRTEDRLEQPLLIKDTECGEYAVVREVDFDSGSVGRVLSI